MNEFDESFLSPISGEATQSKISLNDQFFRTGNKAKIIPKALNFSPEFALN